MSASNPPGSAQFRIPYDRLLDEAEGRVMHLHLHLEGPAAAPKRRAATGALWLGGIAALGLAFAAGLGLSSSGAPSPQYEARYAPSPQGVVPPYAVRLPSAVEGALAQQPRIEQPRAAVPYAPPLPAGQVAPAQGPAPAPPPAARDGFGLQR